MLHFFENHKLVIDKTPRYWEMMNEIRELFPENKIIVLKRNPLEVTKSIFRTWNVDSLDKILPYRKDLLEGPAAIFSFEEKYATDLKTYFLTYEDFLKILKKRCKVFINGLVFVHEYLKD